MSRWPRRAWCEVDLDALTHNLSVFGEAAPGVPLVGVVKADAYGHGALAVAATMRAAGVRTFAIATVEEAVELRQAGFIEPLWHLGVALPEEAAALVQWRVTPTVTSIEMIDALAASLPPGARMPVHLKLDTGMGRRGNSAAELRALWEHVESRPGLYVEAVATHLATADGDLDFARAQLSRLLAFRREVGELGRGVLWHAANSAAILRLPEAHLDFIRPGIAVYGIAAFTAPGAERLRPVMTVKARLCQIRDLPAGHDVGYGHGCRLRRPTRVGLVSIGYGDGWPWSLSGVGVALVAGRRAPYLGRVNMDLLQLDLNSAPEANVGDTVVLLGADGGERLDAVELAGLANTLEYAIPTQLTRRVTRIYRRGDAVVAERAGDGVLRWVRSTECP